MNDRKTIVAHYEFDPFGNEITPAGNKGTKHDVFAHRFSTKYHDVETGLYYYGYRYYDPVTGRWPSRDPIGERGGLNLYAFVGNDGVNRWNYLGMFNPGQGIFPNPDPTNNPSHSLVDLRPMRRELERIRRELHQLFPGEENSCMRHCMGACRSSKEFDAIAAQLAGIVNEIQGLIIHDLGDLRDTLEGNRTMAFQLKDFVDNAKGGMCIDDPRGCEECCRCKCLVRPHEGDFITNPTPVT